MAAPDDLALVRTAIISSCRGDFEWINDTQMLRAGSDERNCGFSGPTIREIAQAWVRGGGAIYREVEGRAHYAHRAFYYYVIVEGIDEFPRGLFVEMELVDDDPGDPQVAILNAHPPAFPGIWG